MQHQKLPASQFENVMRGNPRRLIMACMFSVASIFGIAIAAVDFDGETRLNGSVALLVATVALAAAQFDGDDTRRRVWQLLAYASLVTVAVIMLRAYGITLL